MATEKRTPNAVVPPAVPSTRNAMAAGSVALAGALGPRRRRRQLAAILVLTAGAAVSAGISVFSAAPPATREIHIEAYRYGFSPSRIHANRGDRLRLTFSTRDTGQSFFLQDYGLSVAITPGDNMVLVQDLSDPEAPPRKMGTVEFSAGLPGWRGWLYTKSTFRNHTYNGPLHGTERGDLIVAPNLLLHVSFGLLLAMPLAGLILASAGSRTEPERKLNLFAAFPWLKRLLRRPSFPSTVMLPMLAVLWLIILAGLLGTKVAGRNAASMIIWVLWLSALIIVLVPLGGRVWCTVCPLPAAGELWQRARLSKNPAALAHPVPLRFLGIPLVWPAWLSNAWPRVLLFLLLGTFSTTLVVVPAATSWMLLGLVLFAVVTSFFPEQRLFCRYLCPINSFISIYSTTGRILVRAVAPEPCLGCGEKFCLTGSAKGWGCPYGLCAGELNRNNDCGTCMECVKTCAYNNVAVFWRSRGRDTIIANASEAWQAIVMFSLACLYCYVNLGAWDWIRDWIDIVDRKHWSTFLAYAAAVWIVSLGVLPMIWYLLARTGIALSGLALDARQQFRDCAAAFIPLGLSIWIAFALATFLSMLTFVLQSLSDPFNWGWDLLGRAGSPWHIPFSEAIPAIQSVCLLAGLAFTLATLYRCWCQPGTTKRQAITAMLPHGSFLWASCGGMIFFFAG